jgi:hypothetical protein
MRTALCQPVNRLTPIRRLTERQLTRAAVDGRRDRAIQFKQRSNYWPILRSRCAIHLLDVCTNQMRKAELNTIATEVDHGPPRPSRRRESASDTALLRFVRRHPSQSCRIGLTTSRTSRRRLSTRESGAAYSTLKAMTQREP